MTIPVVVGTDCPNFGHLTAVMQIPCFLKWCPKIGSFWILLVVFNITFFCVFEAETPSRHIEQNLQMKIRHIDISNGHSLGASCSKLPNQIIRWVKIQDIKWTTECFVYLSYQPSMFLGPVLTLSPDGKDSNLLSINIGHP